MFIYGTKKLQQASSAQWLAADKVNIGINEREKFLLTEGKLLVSSLS